MPTTTSPSGVTVEGEFGSSPTITLPEGSPPAGLEITDVVEGDGAEVVAGGTVTVHYKGVSWKKGGQQFDASYDRNDTISFPLNAVITGWGEGLVGMRVGGRRLLVIPPEKGYGPQSPTPAIAPNDTLVFVVDLVEA